MYSTRTKNNVLCTVPVLIVARLPYGSGCCTGKVLHRSCHRKGLFSNMASQVNSAVVVQENSEFARMVTLSLYDNRGNLFWPTIVEFPKPYNNRGITSAVRQSWIFFRRTTIVELPYIFRAGSHLSSEYLNALPVIDERIPDL